MTDNRFRTLLWIYITLIVATIAATALSPHSEALQAAVDRESNSWLWDHTSASITVYAALVVAWLVGLVGLFRFKSWGRSLSLYSTVAGLLAYPLMGSSLSWGVESSLYESSTLLWGAILALAYFSPVSARFGRQQFIQAEVATWPN